PDRFLHRPQSLLRLAMTILLTHEDVRACIDMTEAIEAMETGFREEGEGCTVLPARINMSAGKGWLRVGPAVLERSGWMGFKAMNLARSEEHTSELQSRENLVCRLLLE